MITVYIHIEGLETTMVDIDALPEKTDVLLVGRHPRKRDGKDVDYILPDVNTIIVPLNKILFIEVMTDEREEDFETFIRE